jgi:predicted nucleic acid-binding protein
LLLIDSNILVRVVRGRSEQRLLKLLDRGIALGTTDRSAYELQQVLTTVFNLHGAVAGALVHKAIAPLELLTAEDYRAWRTRAEQRLAEGGKGDWPLLAAALAFEASIWSDDRDFFGVGVPIWSTPNVHLYSGDKRV